MIPCWRCQGSGEIRGWTVKEPDKETVVCIDCLGTGKPVKVTDTFINYLDLAWTERVA